MKVKLLRDQGKNKAGETITVSDRWGKHALRSGLAAIPDKKKTKPAEKPATEKED